MKERNLHYNTRQQELASELAQSISTKQKKSIEREGKLIAEETLNRLFLCIKLSKGPFFPQKKKRISCPTPLQLHKHADIYIYTHKKKHFVPAYIHSHNQHMYTHAFGPQFSFFFFFLDGGSHIFKGSYKRMILFLCSIFSLFLLAHTIGTNLLSITSLFFIQISFAFFFFLSFGRQDLGGKVWHLKDF